MWVFGYGSLIWYTSFPFDKCYTGCVRGFSRRFWQASPDHRGIPEKPGRAVTLINDENGYVWGKAYHVAPEHEVEVRAYLNWREKAGYEPQHVTFHPLPEYNVKPYLVEVFVSPLESQYYVGPEEVDRTAEIVVTSIGPSGTNIEYVLRLVNNLKHIHHSAVDDYLKQLEDKVITLCKQRNITDPTLFEFGYLNNTNS